MPRTLSTVLLCLLLLLPAHSAKALPGMIDFPTDNGFLPKHWQRAPISGSIEKLPLTQRPRVRRILDNAISKYPPSMIRKHLNGVRVVSSLEFYGIHYGGTYTPGSKMIVLAYSPDFDDRGFEQRFHHEFSSILLKANERKFKLKSWSAANPSGFRYKTGGVIEKGRTGKSEATKLLESEQSSTGGDGSSLLLLDEKLMKDGFLTRYNRVSVEQDVNEMAAHLFTNPSLWTYGHRYSRIGTKMNVLIEFYHSLDKSMNTEFFQRASKR